MSAELVTTFMATLAIIGVFGVLASFFVGDARAFVREHGMVLAAAVGVLATLSSLYLSEIADYDPCQYCWWQRIFMYPAGIMLLVAAVRRDWFIRPYVLMLAGIGAAVSLRHIWLQTFPDEGGMCGISGPCSAKLVEAYGFITIPQMTAACFVLIIVLVARCSPSSQETP